MRNASLDFMLDKNSPEFLQLRQTIKDMHDSMFNIDPRRRREAQERLDAQRKAETAALWAEFRAASERSFLAAKRRHRVRK